MTHEQHEMPKYYPITLSCALFSGNLRLWSFRYGCKTNV